MPDIVAPSYLRWSLVRGPGDDGSVRWLLREHGHNAIRLAVPAVPTTEELYVCISALAGWAVAQSLVDETIDDLPDLIAPVQAVAHPPG